jgi:protein phosphatase methylesterase 1
VDTLTNVEKNERISGCIIIDVGEGTAIEALPFMNQIIAERPKHFDSVHNGIKWCYNTCTIRKLESARVSMPGQLTEI